MSLDYWMKENVDLIRRLKSSRDQFCDPEFRTAVSELLAEIEKACEFDYLRSLLGSDSWPKAVPDEMIADENSEDEKDERAEGIVNILLPPLDGMKFLDFGCGEGHVANYVSKNSACSVGYDLVKSEKSRFLWEEDVGNLFLTANFDVVRSKAPYDVVLLYDVLDHSHKNSPGEILSMVESVLSDSGKAYVRTHPWTSRHGGHAYRKINKAFAHLVFTGEEMASMGVELESNIKSLFPKSTYDTLVLESALKNSVEPEPDLQDVEPFFKDNHAIRDRILSVFGVQEWGEIPSWQMSQCFWDYILEKDFS